MIAIVVYIAALSLVDLRIFDRHIHESCISYFAFPSVQCGYHTLFVDAIL